MSNGPEGDVGWAKEWGEQRAQHVSVLYCVRIRPVSNRWQNDCSIKERCCGGDDKVTAWGSVGLGSVTLYCVNMAVVGKPAHLTVEHCFPRRAAML